MPLLSIITINYNNAAGLQKTIKSVNGQLFRDFEFIIIDGGSNDGSAELIKHNTQALSYWVSEKDNGIYHAQNKGLARAVGYYCLFLNSGDYLLDANVLNRTFESNPTEDILYGDLVFDSGEKSWPGKLPVKLNKEFLFTGNVWHPATFVKRQLFHKYGDYNTQYKIAADYDFFFHTIAVRNVSTRHLAFPVSVYDTYGLSSNSASLEKINNERKLIHKNYLSDTEIEYLSNVSKFKIKKIARWLVGKPLVTKFFNALLQVYSKLRN